MTLVVTIGLVLVGLHAVVAYLLGINLVTFAAYGLDKFQARRRGWRVSEATLLGLAFLGGTVAAVVAQYLFRHKLSKRSFVVAFLLVAVVQAAVLFVWWRA